MCKAVRKHCSFPVFQKKHFNKRGTCSEIQREGTKIAVGVVCLEQYSVISQNWFNSKEVNEEGQETEQPKWVTKVSAAVHGSVAS